jgi:hypothetical protein
MTSIPASVFRSDGIGGLSCLGALSFASSRLALAQALVVFSFVWPFFNYQLIDPLSLTEINFLPVFLAALLLPEVALRERRSLLLAMPAFAVALIWANPTAPMRLAVGIVPLHFVLNLTRHLRERGRELIPPNLGYRCLQVFVVFCMVQTVHFTLFPVIPEWFITALMTVLPRFLAAPYDNSGIRGVQGWASEPSSAALTCIAFSLVAIEDRPERRWRVLALFAFLSLMNKSVYSLLLFILLGLCCLFTLRRKLHSLLAIVPMSLAVLFYMESSGRIAELYGNLLVNGVNREVNPELMRFAQMLYPLEYFPKVYQPAALFGSALREPIGLLPLVAGYGSLAGLAWLAWMLVHNPPPRMAGMRPMALLAALVLLLLTTPDLIPSVVALAVFLVPRTRQPVRGESSRSCSVKDATSVAGGNR